MKYTTSFYETEILNHTIAGGKKMSSSDKMYNIFYAVNNYFVKCKTKRSSTNVFLIWTSKTHKCEHSQT